MLSSKENRQYWSTMYNDEIMILWYVISVYFAMKNSPIIASFFLTLGLSVKAGVVLALPGFLGSI